MFNFQRDRSAPDKGQECLYPGCGKTYYARRNVWRHIIEKHTDVEKVDMPALIGNGKTKKEDLKITGFSSGPDEVEQSLCSDRPISVKSDQNTFD